MAAAHEFRFDGLFLGMAEAVGGEQLPDLGDAEGVEKEGVPDERGALILEDGADEVRPGLPEG